MPDDLQPERSACRSGKTDCSPAHQTRAIPLQQCHAMDSSIVRQISSPAHPRTIVESCESHAADGSAGFGENTRVQLAPYGTVMDELTGVIRVTNRSMDKQGFICGPHGYTWALQELQQGSCEPAVMQVKLMQNSSNMRHPGKTSGFLALQKAIVC